MLFPSTTGFGLNPSVQHGTSKGYACRRMAGRVPVGDIAHVQDVSIGGFREESFVANLAGGPQDLPTFRCGPENLIAGECL